MTNLYFHSFLNSTVFNDFSISLSAFFNIASERRSSSEKSLILHRKKSFAEFSLLQLLPLNENWYTYFKILAYSGARKSEILALKWSDIDFDNYTYTININKTLTRGLNNRIIMQPTKTVNGRRVIDMDNKSMKLLKEWKIQQAQFMFKLGFNTNSSDQLVFSNTRNNFYSINVPNLRIKNVQNGMV